MEEEDLQKHNDGESPEDFQLKNHVVDVSEDSKPPRIQESDHDSAQDDRKRWPGWPGENVFRMLIPVQKVGSIIGRKGESIKKITEETKARIKILDGPPGTLERAVIVSAKEEPNMSISPAMDGLLRIHKQIIGADDPVISATSGNGGQVVTRLLVADAQAGSLIGKQGFSIKSIQDASGCTIRVLGAEHLPVFALQDDSIVEIHGEPTGVHHAVELIVSHLRKFLVDRSIIGVFEMQMQMPNVRSNQNMLPQQPCGPQDFQNNDGGGTPYGYNPQYLLRKYQYDNYLPPFNISDFNEQSHQGGVPMYERDTFTGHSSNAQPQKLVVGKVTQHMQVPILYADAVIGISGANISYIRRASGAKIAIQETRGVSGEMTVEVNGSASQIQTAQQLIQNFLAEASSKMQNHQTGESITQGFNAYPAHSISRSTVEEYTPYPAEDLIYSSQPYEATGHLDHAPTGDYGSVYGNNYEY